MVTALHTTVRSVFSLLTGDHTKCEHLRTSPFGLLRPAEWLVGRSLNPTSTSQKISMKRPFSGREFAAENNATEETDANANGSPERIGTNATSRTLLSCPAPNQDV